MDGIVEGTVQRSGDRVRITAQLVHGPSDKHLWANSYERDMRDVFTLERDVAQDIASQIQTQVPTTAPATQVQGHPVNPRALDAYLEGSYHLRRVAHGSVDEELNKAAVYFQQAIDSDPTFAPAYLGLSEARGSHLRDSVEDATESARLLEKAIQLDPNSAEAWLDLGESKLYYFWDWAGAEKDIRQAIALNPSNADAHAGLSRFFYAMGRIDEGWSESQIAQELDPHQDHLSLGLDFRHEYDREIETLLRWVKLYPDDGEAYGSLYSAYAEKGMRKEAIEALVRGVILHGLPTAGAHIERAYSTSGYEAAIRTFAQELEQLDSTKQAFLPGITADAYAVIGDKERAFYWMEQAYQHRELVGREPGILFIKVDPMLDSLRSDPRCKDLIRRMGLAQ